MSLHTIQLFYPTFGQGIASNERSNPLAKRFRLEQAQIHPIILKYHEGAYSTISAAVVEVLNHYLPENGEEWSRLLEEAGMSRIWAGIHFPIDHEQGKVLGKQVGQAFISSNKQEKLLE